MADGKPQDEKPQKKTKTKQVVLTMGDLKRSASVALQPLGRVRNEAKVVVSVIKR